MKIIVFENSKALDLEPLSLTRPVFDIRAGQDTFLERIQHRLPEAPLALFVRDELGEFTGEKHPDLEVNPAEVSDESVWILGNVFWTAEQLRAIQEGNNGAYYVEDELVAVKCPPEVSQEWITAGGPINKPLMINLPRHSLNVSVVCYLWELLEQIDITIDRDTEVGLIPAVNPNQFPDVSMLSPDNIYIGPNVEIGPQSVLNANNGPIILADDVRISSLVYLEGPLVIGSETLIAPHTQIKKSIIGPLCKIGGEINESIFQGYANKVHGGHLGNAVIGEWVNLGAGTTNSNLKNNYAPVSVMINGTSIKTGERHLGCFIGDHTKTAIGTFLNTGTVIGPGCNIVSAGFPPKMIRPFTWFINGKHRVTDWNKFIETAKVVMQRRNQQMNPAEEELLKTIFKQR